VTQALGSDMQQRIWHQLLPALRAAVAEPWLELISLTRSAYEAGPLFSTLVPCDARLQQHASRLIAALQQFGTALSSLPLSQACNNPACVNTACHSEQRLVGGPKTVCAGCGRARYCSRACQVQHWSAAHKAVCKQLREVAAGAAAASDAPAAAAVSKGAAAAGGGAEAEE
jgi:hypothetical protein